MSLPVLLFVGRDRKLVERLPNIPIDIKYYIITWCNYRSQRSWGKVIFSQASVILSTGGCLVPGVSSPRGVSGPGWVSAPGEGGPWGRPPSPGTTTATGMHSYYCKYVIF